MCCMFLTDEKSTRAVQCTASVEKATISFSLVVDAFTLVLKFSFLQGHYLRQHKLI